MYSIYFCLTPFVCEYYNIFSCEVLAWADTLENICMWGGRILTPRHNFKTGGPRAIAKNFKCIVGKKGIHIFTFEGKMFAFLQYSELLCSAPAKKRKKKIDEKTQNNLKIVLK